MDGEQQLNKESTHPDSSLKSGASISNSTNECVGLRCVMSHYIRAYNIIFGRVQVRAWDHRA